MYKGILRKTNGEEEVVAVKEISLVFLKRKMGSRAEADLKKELDICQKLNNNKNIV